MISLRKALFTLLAPLGATTIIGTGFATWVFGNQGVPVEGAVNNNVAVTAEVTNGEIDISSCPNLLVFSSGTFGNSDLFDGITFYNNNDFEHGGTSFTETINDSTLSFKYIYSNENLVDPVLSGLSLNIGICFELNTKEGATTIPNTDISCVMSDYLQITDNIKQSQYNVDYEGHNYFLMNKENDSIEYAKSNLGFQISTVSVNGGSTYIDFSLTLNEFLRYKNSSIKPIDQKTYSNITNASKVGEWKFSIHLIAFYTEYLGDSIK